MATMNPPHEHPTLDALKSRLDDLRVQIHLGGMEAEDELDALLHETERLGRKSAHATAAEARRLLERVRELESRLIVGD